MASDGASPAPAAPHQYDSDGRVALIAIFGRPDKGAGLVGQRIVVGGWVTSSKAFIRTDPSAGSEKPPGPIVRPNPNKDLSCAEIIQTALPLARSIFRIFGMNAQTPPEKPERRTVPQPTPPQTAVLQIGDGSCVPSLHVVVEPSVSPAEHVLATGTCVLVKGVVVKAPPHEKHQIQLVAEKVLHIGMVDVGSYPLSKKRLPLESLRDWLHLRHRTRTVAAIMRIRASLAAATNTFLQTHGFLCVHVPVLTTTDTAPPSDKFRVAAASSPTPTEKRALEEDYFERPTFLTVSGRLHLESYACALGNVYSFGPRFRRPAAGSENQAAEMWMLEIEMAFAQLEGAVKCACDLVGFISDWVRENCSEDMKFLSKRAHKSCIGHLQSVTAASFQRISYRDAVEQLRKVSEKKSVGSRMAWGAALTEEQLGYLADEIYKKPIMICDFPKEVKPFHARLNNDGITVAAFDLVLPKVGTLIWGTQNEERIDLMEKRIKELGLEQEEYEWYLELRRHGSAKHSGITLAFDHLVLAATGMADLREVIPFPRTSPIVIH